MKVSTVVLFFIQTIIISCSGQQAFLEQESNSEESVGKSVSDLGTSIMVVFQDSKNNYWFGSWESGLYLYDGKTIINYTTKDGLPHNRIDQIVEDASGNILINTSGGICKFDGKSFETISYAKADNVWKLEPNDLWFRQGWELPQVARYDGDSLHLLTIPTTELGNAYELAHPNYPASPYAAYSIYKDSKGNMWFGTAVLGVFKYDGRSFDWISEKDVTEIHDGPANGVRSIAEDKDGFFWFNTAYRYKIDDANDSFGFYSREKSIGELDGKNDGRLNEYLSIVKDDNNDLWIVTYLDGVWKYDGKEVKQYLITLGNKKITTFSIYKDNSGGLWVGTHENGVYKFNGTTFQQFKL